MTDLKKKINNAEQATCNWIAKAHVKTNEMACSQKAKHNILNDANTDVAKNVTVLLLYTSKCHSVTFCIHQPDLKHDYIIREFCLRN